MFVTFAVAVPLPLVTVQTCAGFDGWVRTVTLYVLFLAMGEFSAKGPLPVTGVLLLPLFCSTSPVPARPETVPPMEYVVAPLFPPPPPHATRVAVTMSEMTSAQYPFARHTPSFLIALPLCDIPMFSRRYSRMAQNE